MGGLWQKINLLMATEAIEMKMKTVYNIFINMDS